MSQLKKLCLLTKDFTVLYIEDDLILREKTYIMLNNLFKHIDTACNGKEGFSLYQEYYNCSGKYYDLVITDIKMPLMDGVTLSKKIRILNSKQIIIVTSAHDESKYLIEFINMSINKFIQKPFSLDTITTTFFELFENHSKILSHIIIDEEYYWDKETKKLFCNFDEIKLSYNEIIIFDILVCNQNTIFSAHDLISVMSSTNNINEITENTLKSAIKRLRKKLPKNIIMNYYGQGYSISLFDTF